MHKGLGMGTRDTDLVRRVRTGERERGTGCFSRGIA